MIVAEGPEIVQGVARGQSRSLSFRDSVDAMKSLAESLHSQFPERELLCFCWALEKNNIL